MVMSNRIGYCISVCVDTNECALHNGGCSQQCVNSYGSYKCCCDAGYTLSQNDRTCNGNVCHFESLRNCLFFLCAPLDGSIRPSVGMDISLPNIKLHFQLLYVNLDLFSIIMCSL